MMMAVCNSHDQQKELWPTKIDTAPGEERHDRGGGDGGKVEGIMWEFSLAREVLGMARIEATVMEIGVDSDSRPWRWRGSGGGGHQSSVELRWGGSFESGCEAAHGCATAHSSMLSGGEREERRTQGWWQVAHGQGKVAGWR
jgi:hypothetical protein